MSDNYNIYRRDRDANCDKSRGGGVLFAIRKDIDSTLVFSSKSHEILAIEITQKNQPKVLLVTCYRPPGSNITEFVNEFYSILSMQSKKYKLMCVVGDFNFPGVKWSDNCGISSSMEENLFLDILSEYSFCQLNNNPSTSHGNILDLVLTNFSEGFSDITAMQNQFSSDHFPLTFTMSNIINKKGQQVRTVFNYKKANIAGLKQSINEAKLEACVENSLSVENAWQTILSCINNAVNLHVPTIKLKKCPEPPGFDKDIRHLRNCKNTAWRQARRRKSAKALLKYKKMRNKLQRALKNNYASYINSLGISVTKNPKKFWSFVKTKTGTKSVPETMKVDNRDVTNKKEIAEAFNKYFNSVFSANEPCNADFNVTQNRELCFIQLTEQEVLKILEKLDIKKAKGPDNISPIILKDCRLELCKPLCKLFNMSLSKGYVPEDWRKANVVPIYKSGDRQSVTNYRPVSLLSIISKVLERCIYNRLSPLISLNNMQHGFVRGKSTCTQLSEFVHHVGKSLDLSGQTDILYLDFAKAFDTVPHKLLLHKLRVFYGIGGPLLKWFSSYLSNRSQSVVLQGGQSSWLPVTSGVQQGSILGPLLFLLYINDIPTQVTHSQIALFADDTKIYMPVNDDNDCVKLQNDLNALMSWSRKWKMKFNVSKCKILTVTQRKSPIIFNYCMDNIKLLRCANIKDIGVTLDNKLNWSTHIESIVSKANKVMGVIKRTVGYSAPVTVKKQLYISLVRSKLEYCSQIWSGTTIQNIQLIERAQRSATKYILQRPELNYHERLRELNMLPLTYRREYLDMCMFYKILNNIIDINVANYVEFTSENIAFTRSTLDITKLRIPKMSTALFQKTYFNRIVFLWNKLPENIRNMTKLATFKKYSYHHFMNLLHNYFDCENKCTWAINCRCQKCLMK